MQISGGLQIWIAIFFIVLSLAVIAFVVFIGIVLIQFKKNLKAFELLISEGVFPIVSEVRVALSRINNIITNIDVSVSKLKDSISEVRNTVGKVISSTKNVVGIFNKPWIKIIVSGVVKGLEFIRKNKQPHEVAQEQSEKVDSEEVK